jgi:hypothetical protein
MPKKKMMLIISLKKPLNTKLIFYSYCHIYTCGWVGTMGEKETTNKLAITGGQSGEPTATKPVYSSVH